MKNKILIFGGLLLLFFGNLSSKERAFAINFSQGDSTNVFSSPDLFNLTSTWTSKYNILNPSAKIKVNSIDDPKTIDLYGSLNLGFISHEYYSAFNKKPGWKEVLGRDVLVPIFNSSNPFLDKILQQGISSEELTRLFTNSQSRNWGTLLGNGENLPVKYYLINNEAIKSAVENFLHTDQFSLEGITVKNGKEMVSEIQKNPGALGFCKLKDIIDSKNQQIVENIKLMPIDKNGNGKIDYSEQIYDDLNGFLRAVWIGKYPKALYNNIYSISSLKPTNEIELAFLKWILTDGQQFVTPNGYCELALNERQIKVDELNTSKMDLAASDNDYAKLKMVILILAIFLLSGFILDAGFRYRKFINAGVQVMPATLKSEFNEKTVGVLNGLYFDKSHTWAFMDKDGLVKIGIDDFLQHITGSITQVKMKNPGEMVKKCEPFLSIIHKGKQITINAPVNGIIKEQNHHLIKNSTLVNSSPYSDGWIYRIEPTNWIRDIQFLFMGEKYKLWLKDEFSRLKDFLAVFIKPGSSEYAQVILQDGGEIKDGPLADLGPEVWEDFQINFINVSR